MANEQIGNTLTFLAFYTANGVGSTGLTVTVDVRRGSTIVVTDGSVTEIGGGLYRYSLASGSVTTEDLYTAVFKTSNTSVDQKQLPALWTVGIGGVEHLDTNISAVAAAVWASGTRTLTSFGTLVADVATAVWASGARTLTSFGTLATDVAAAVWASGSRTLTSFGTLIADIWANVTRTITGGSLTTPPPTAESIAEAVGTRTVPSSPPANTADALWRASGASGDPWATDITTGYDPDTAAFYLTKIGTANATVVSPVTTTGAVTLYQNATYSTALGTALVWTLASALALGSAAVTLDVGGVSYAGAITGSVGAWVITVQLTAVQTAAMTRGVTRYDLSASVSGAALPPLVTGSLTVLKNV